MLKQKVPMQSFLIVSYGNKFIHIQLMCCNMTGSVITIDEEKVQNII